VHQQQLVLLVPLVLLVLLLWPALMAHLVAWRHPWRLPLTQPRQTQQLAAARPATPCQLQLVLALGCQARAQG
jgi:hypothetical protein